MQKLTFLGTGTSQGVPVIACNCPVCASADPRDSRLRTSALLQMEGKNILFDIGPDFRQQILRHRINSLDAVLVTHAHRDHVAGIDDIRPLNYVQRSHIDLYLNTIAADTLRRDYRYIFTPHNYPGLPEVNLHEVDSPFTTAGLHVIPIHAMHKDLPIFGYRIADMAYITDTNHLPPTELDKLRGLKVLVINALRIKPHWSHYSLQEALEIVKTLAPERAFLTHISHEMGLHSEVQDTLPKGVSLAYDNLEVTL